jgi:NAD/NADP transhydrogenase alpha subunit
MHGVDLSGPVAQLLLSRLLAMDQLLLLELSYCPWVTDNMMLEVLSSVRAARGGLPLLAAAEQASRVLQMVSRFPSRRDHGLSLAPTLALVVAGGGALSSCVAVAKATGADVAIVVDGWRVH